MSHYAVYHPTIIHIFSPFDVYERWLTVSRASNKRYTSYVALEHLPSWSSQDSTRSTASHNSQPLLANSARLPECVLRDVVLVGLGLTTATSILQTYRHTAHWGFFPRWCMILYTEAAAIAARYNTLSRGECARRGIKDLRSVYHKHTYAGKETEIRIVEAEADSSLPEDITHPLKRRRLADTRADEVRAEIALLPNIRSDAPRVDDGAFFGLCHMISDCTSVGDVEPDAVDPSLDYVSRSLKRKRSADTSTYGVRAKRARTSGTSNDATKAEDRACFGLGHIPIHGCTKIGVVEPDADPSVAPNIDIHVLLETIARPPKRKRCADTTTDEVRVKRRRLSDSPSDASKLKSGGPLGPHPRCMITGCVSAEVEACYILPPDTPQPLGDCTTLRMPTDSNAAYCSTPANIIFLLRDLRILWDTNRLLMIPHPDHIDHPDTRPVYKYYVVAEDEHPSSSRISKDHTIRPPVATTCSPCRSLGWHELSANLHLMTIRVGREFMKRPLHYEYHLSKDAFAHSPIIRLAQHHALESVSSHIDQQSLVEDIPRPRKRKRCPDTETDEVPAQRMRTSGTARNAFKVEDGIPFGPHPRCMITGCVSADVEACYILPPDMPQLLVYEYCIIAEDEHLPDSCTTMGHPITHSVMTAPCSYRSLGWHELNANLRLTMFRAGQKLSKRPLHYQHVLRGLLPHKEANHAYSIASQYMSWTIPVPSEMVPDRRLWATGEPSACPDGYFHWPVRQYCSPLSDDDAVRFSTPFRPIVSRLKRKRSGDTSMGTLAYTTKKSAQRAVSVRQWCLDCDQARVEWTMGPPAEPEDAELLAYQQGKIGDVLPAVQDLWSLETHFSRLISSLIPHFVTITHALQVLNIRNGLTGNLFDPPFRLELL
ncbi:hypothetical protein IEO21_09429 [Rhodonia placenta]|uniref:HNH nuclease domain-containing protein n=1 Tax=Rhodonia placenta TaxID=104341 RepID=A0A8H7NUT2_9APHY|nr:hypothetical protein IEO21_09429 [Postia placenta]